MKKIKALTAVIMIVSVLAICSLSAYGAMTTISCSTYADWNAQETQVRAKTDTYAPSASHYYADAFIRVNTGCSDYNYAYFTAGGSNSVTTNWLYVNYAIEPPFVTNIDGGYWFD